MVVSLAPRVDSINRKRVIPVRIHVDIRIDPPGKAAYKLELPTQRASYDESPLIWLALVISQNILRTAN